MNVGPLVVPDTKASKLIEPGKCPLDDPAPSSQTAAVLGAAHRQQRQDAASSQPGPDCLCIIAAVSHHTIWTTPRPSPLALEWKNRIHQSRRRRQHVIPDPHPSSCGSICQGMPLRRTKTMPVRHARSETRGRPPCGLRGRIGNKGSTRSHNRSGSNAAAIRRSRYFADDDQVRDVLLRALTHRLTPSKLVLPITPSRDVRSVAIRDSRCCDREVR